MSLISPLGTTPAIAALDRSAPSARAAAPTGDVSFGEILSQMTSEAASTIRAGESAGIAGVQGQATVQQVVDAAMSAERSLHTMIALRDKVVGAYQEISKMTI